MKSSSRYIKFDWVIILLFVALVFIGWVNIYSASLNDANTVFMDFDQVYLKQLIWIGLSALLIVFILALDAKFYERFASIIFIVSMVSLILLCP